MRNLLDGFYSSDPNPMRSDALISVKLRRDDVNLTLSVYESRLAIFLAEKKAAGWTILSQEPNRDYQQEQIDREIGRAHV